MTKKDWFLFVLVITALIHQVLTTDQQNPQKCTSGAEADIPPQCLGEELHAHTHHETDSDPALDSLKKRGEIPRKHDHQDKGTVRKRRSQKQVKSSEISVHVSMTTSNAEKFKHIIGHSCPNLEGCNISTSEGISLKERLEAAFSKQNEDRTELRSGDSKNYADEDRVGGFHQHQYEETVDFDKDDLDGEDDGEDDCSGCSEGKTDEAEDGEVKSINAYTESLSPNVTSEDPNSASDAPETIFRPKTDPLADIVLPKLSASLLSPVLTEDGARIRLGKGRFGVVYIYNMVFPDNTEEEIALKLFKKPKWWEVKEEAQILMYLSHTGLVPTFYGLVDVETSNGTQTGLAMEMIKGRTMAKLLDKHSRFLTRHNWMQISKILVTSLMAFHAADTLVNDIKPDNIMIDVEDPDNPEVIFVDMGSSTVSYTMKYTFSLETLHYYPNYAPEVKKGQMTSIKSDVYALGRTLRKIACRDLVPGISEIAAKCMRNRPEERPTLEQLYEELLALEKELWELDEFVI